MKDFTWGNMDKGTMFLDHKATLVPRNLRILFVQVAQQYSSEGDTAKAKEKLGFQTKFGVSKMCLDTWRWQSLNPEGY